MDGDWRQYLAGKKTVNGVQYGKYREDSKVNLGSHYSQWTNVVP